MLFRVEFTVIEAFVTIKANEKFYCPKPIVWDKPSKASGGLVKRNENRK